MADPHKPPAPKGLWQKIRRVWRNVLQPLERQFKTHLFSTVGKLLGARRARQLPAWGAGPQQVLLLRLGRIGDMVLATGLIHEMALAQPALSIDVLAAPGNAAVLEGNPHVRRVMTIQTTQARSVLSALRAIRRARYDAVVDPLFPKASLTYMLLMLLSGARHRIAIAGRGNDFALTLPVPALPAAVHHVDQTAALLAAFGVDLERRVVPCAAPPLSVPGPGVSACRAATGWGIFHSRLYLNPTERQAGEARWPPGAALRLLVNISVSSPERQWRQESFIAALQELKARCGPGVPLTVCIVGAPQDAQRMERIAHATGAHAAQTPHYRQMMAIVAACDLVLTGDTAVTHVACAFGKPVLALFAGHGGAVFGPYSGGSIISTSAATLAPLEVEPVVEGLEALIGHLSRAALEESASGSAGRRARH